jgi:hypothetical protein
VFLEGFLVHHFLATYYMGISGWPGIGFGDTHGQVGLHCRSDTGSGLLVHRTYLGGRPYYSGAGCFRSLAFFLFGYGPHLDMAASEVLFGWIAQDTQ